MTMTAPVRDGRAQALLGAAPAAAGDDASVLAPAPRRRRALGRGWYRLAGKAQLLATFVAIGRLAALVGGGVTILQARKSTQLEIAASLRMAEILVGETTELQQQQQQLSAEQFLVNL